ncbi:uncharacterized protein LOC129727456 [Wyeomyia smithii]|uniref:uncharacterized protein LOC129727456 n=1 Tax=Wyeomyia smithii TaxID=174621 RepID=UPI002467FCEF|nr:uncharacterized protein LOC129727456 [Wyeomyia smithii]
MWKQFFLVTAIMQLLQWPTAVTAANLLCVFSLLLVPSSARYLSHNPDALDTELLNHHDYDETIIHPDESFKQQSIENDEDNEVISVRLLNSFISNPYSSTVHEVQDVFYENIQTTSPDTGSSITEPPHYPATTEDDLLRSTHESTENFISSTTESIVEHLNEETSISTTSRELQTTTKPIYVQTSAALVLTPAAVPIETTTEQVITPLAPVIGTRKRVARNFEDFKIAPEIDLKRLNFGNMHGLRIRDLLASSLPPESTEQSDTPSTNTKSSAECPCSSRKTRKSVDYDTYDDYTDYEQPPAVQFPRLKNLFSDQGQSQDNDAPETDTAIERAERIQGALERIMGIVTIISHVDNFIQKKTKQSIKRLARLYESGEE